MRVPTDVPSRPRPVRRYQLWVLGAVVFLIIAVIVVQGLANFYTNYLWYRSVHYTAVWRLMTETKLELAAVFVGVFFVACWASLWVVDRIAPRALLVSPELEIVRRYQQIVAGHTFALRTVVSLILALILGVSTDGQWQHWLMFQSGKAFGTSDPQFHKAVGFYVFKLPFLSFLVDWTLVSLLLLLIVTSVSHYLNGGLRFQGPSPRVDPRVIAHLSVILAAMALVRSAGYFYVDRYNLVFAKDSICERCRLHRCTCASARDRTAGSRGPGGVRADGVQRLPAQPGAPGYRVRPSGCSSRITAGVIVPALVQALKVTPAQSTLEIPYITRNIDVPPGPLSALTGRGASFAGVSNLTGGVVAGASATLGQSSAVGALDHLPDLPEAAAEWHRVHHRRALARPLPDRAAARPRS